MTTEHAFSLLFTGHMVDLPGRTSPRFPPELVSPARDEIARRIAHHVCEGTRTSIKGFASLARGGDILFHEVCRALGIETVIVLPFSPAKFLKTSVEGAQGGDWANRFHDIWDKTVPEAKYDLDLPESDHAYAACNERLFDLARAHGAVQLIALWDRAGGGGSGGTADFVERVGRESGNEPDIIAPKDLFP
jgi:hypothetical protein